MNAAPATIAESIAPRRAVSLEDLAASFAEFVDASPITVECYSRNVRLFLEWLRSRGISAPTARDVLTYKRELAEKKSAATVSARLAAVRSFFRWTATLPEGAGHYPNIADGIKGVRIERGSKKDAFTPDQVRRILEEAHGESLEALRNYALLALMFTTGLRAVEASRANIEDFRPRGGCMVLYVQGKGRADRTEFVQIRPKTEDAIRAYLAARGPLTAKDPLFGSLSRKNRGDRISPNAMGRILKAAFVSAGFNSPFWVGHSTRVSAATESLMRGNSIFDVQRLLRHADTKTTEIYLRGIDRLASHCEADLEDAFL